MAQVIRTSQFPNLLVLQGTDVAARNSGNQWYHLLRNGVKNALFSDTNGIGNFRGQTDFIICYVVSGAGLDFSGVDHTPANEMPPLRPLRGIIQLSPNLRTPVINNMLVGHLSGAIGHEIGHYWLIPGRARVRIGNQEIDTPTANEIAMSLNNGLGMPKVPMIGRQDTHWSPFIHTEGSFMDGIDHAFDPFNPILERLYGFSKSTGISGSGVTFDFEGQTITTAHKFNDFELFLMGLSPTMGTPANRKLQILESSWVYPLPFHAGLYVELQNGETWYHGFHTGPNQIRALPTSSLSQDVNRHTHLTRYRRRFVV